MIEVFLQKRDEEWDLKASILPFGGLGIARDAGLVSLKEESFTGAVEALQSVSSVSFQDNPNRWPVAEPKFQIINLGTNPDSKNFGDYNVVMDDKVVGQILNFSRASHIELIREALKIITAKET